MKAEKNNNYPAGKSSTFIQSDLQSTFYRDNLRWTF